MFHLFYFIVLFYFVVFELGSHGIDMPGPKLRRTFSLSLPGGWDYRQKLPCPAQLIFNHYEDDFFCNSVGEEGLFERGSGGQCSLV